jgi:hypothetical protein
LRANLLEVSHVTGKSNLRRGKKQSGLKLQLTAESLSVLLEGASVTCAIAKLNDFAPTHFGSHGGGNATGLQHVCETLRSALRLHAGMFRPTQQHGRVIG